MIEKNFPSFPNFAENDRYFIHELVKSNPDITSQSRIDIVPFQAMASYDSGTLISGNTLPEFPLFEGLYIGKGRFSSTYNGNSAISFISPKSGFGYFFPFNADDNIRVGDSNFPLFTSIEFVGAPTSGRLLYYFLGYKVFLS